MTVREKAELIVKDIKKEQGTNPVVIFKQIAEKEYISIHGPEHHILDGASLLVAYKNAGGEIDLEQALDRLMSEGLRMPGAMCGLWGICGAITSIGAALAIIDGTGPLSTDGTWGNHMQFTSKAIGELGAINGAKKTERIKMATDGVLRGLGIMRPFLVANMVNLAIRLSVALICAPCFDIAFVWLAVPAGWLANFLISYVALRKSWPIDKSNLSR